MQVETFLAREHAGATPTSRAPAAKCGGSRAPAIRRAPRIRGALVLFTFLLGLAQTAMAQPSRWTADAWIEDLDYLETRIRASHGNPYHALGQGALRDGVEELRKTIPTLTDFEIAFAMQRLVASLGDGHSWLYYYKKNLTRYFPFHAYVFSDGLTITEAGRGHDAAVGARVIAIDGVPVASVREALLPYISRDNEMDVLRQLPLLIQQPMALHAAGVAHRNDRATFSLRTRDGAPLEVEFSGLATDAYKAWRRSLPEPEDPPRYLANKDEYYWYQELPGEDAVYFQFNRFRDKPEKKFVVFVEELFEFVDSTGIDCLVIDVRHNAGGWTRLVDPLVERIRKHPRISRPGHLYMITGRDTFSSSLMLSVRLERGTGVLFAGEPGTGKPNSYGEFNPYALPNTGLTGSIASLYHQESDPYDSRAKVDVDLPAPLSYDDYVHHRDPALEVVLNHWRSLRTAASQQRLGASSE